jgi:ABC-type multidrug transport system fused ATPase/permease subunit
LRIASQTVRLADRIVVLERGGIVEEGTEAELLACKAKYAHFYRLQMSREAKDTFITPGEAFTER